MSSPAWTERDVVALSDERDADALCPELAVVRRRLDRERRSRHEAETIGERTTAELYKAVQELRHAEAELRDQADQERMLRELAREVRQDLDPDALVRRAVTALGRGLDVDRCLVRVVEDFRVGEVIAEWTRPGVPSIGALDDLPPSLQSLTSHSTTQDEGLWIGDLLDDPRLGERDGRHVAEVLTARAYAGTPMWVGTELVGWLVLHGLDAPHPWTGRERAVAEGLARDLGTYLLQARSYQQEETVRMLRELDAVKSEFVSTVSHELRTPLTSICGYLELLVDGDKGELNDEQLRVVEVVDRNSQRLLRLIEDLLMLSRVDTSPLRRDTAVVDVAAVVADAHRAVLPMLRGRTLEVAVAPTSAATTLGDRAQLDRVALNLLSNAIKFTADDGRVDVAVEVDGATVRLVVADSGIGIPPSELDQLFTRFFRSSTAQQLAIQGTGLGLAVVKAIVDAHHGSIAVSSAPGVGTTFTVTLPRVADPPPG
jgi:signal transduction histidine kinase